MESETFTATAVLKNFVFCREMCFRFCEFYRFQKLVVFLFSICFEWTCQDF